MTLLAPARTVAILGAGASLMWSSVVEDLVDRLVPDGGKGLLGKEKLCSECQGRGYTRKKSGCLAGLLCGTLLDFRWDNRPDGRRAASPERINSIR
jgi:hypothetical protein